MKRNSFFLAMVVFFAIKLFLASAVLAGVPPSAKIKNLPANYQGNQEVLLAANKKIISQRTVNVAIEKNGSVSIKVSHFFLGNVGLEGFKIEGNLEVEGEYLEVKNSSIVNKRFKRFRIDGDDILFLEGSEGKLGSSILYSPVILERKEYKEIKEDFYPPVESPTEENPFLGVWKGCRFFWAVLAADQDRSERDLTIIVGIKELLLINHTSEVMQKGPYVIKEGKLIWNVPISGGGYYSDQFYTFTFVKWESEDALEGRFSLTPKEFIKLKKRE